MHRCITEVQGYSNRYTQCIYPCFISVLPLYAVYGDMVRTGKQSEVGMFYSQQSTPVSVCNSLQWGLTWLLDCRIMGSWQANRQAITDTLTVYRLGNNRGQRSTSKNN